jgi:hypothetical protein
VYKPTSERRRERTGDVEARFFKLFILIPHSGNSFRNTSQDFVV